MHASCRLWAHLGRTDSAASALKNWSRGIHATSAIDQDWPIVILKFFHVLYDFQNMAQTTLSLYRQVLVCLYNFQLSKSQHASNSCRLASAGVLPGLSIAGHKLAKHDAETGNLEWSTELASPIVAVLPPAGEPTSMQDSPARLQSQSAATALPSRPSR